MAETTILLVRHPETVANVTGRFVGRGSSPYTAVGRLQARRMPQRILRFEPSEILSSPLERACAVARRAAHAGGISLVVDERLVELDFGRAEGMTHEEISQAGLAFDYLNLDAPVAPGGESRRSLELRTAEVCDELVVRGGRFAVVTHAGVFRAALVHLLGLSSTDIWAFHIKNAQFAEVRVVDGHGMIEEFVQG